jgi:hypothetical protein
MKLVYISTSLSEDKFRKSQKLLESFDPQMRLARRADDSGVSLIVFNPKTELSIKRRPDCLSVTHQSLKQMKTRHLNPFTFSSPSKTILNLSLMNLTIAFVNIRSSGRLTFLVQAMCGTVSDSIESSTDFVITDDKNATQSHPMPVVHSSWLEALKTNPTKLPNSYFVPIQSQNTFSQPSKPSFGPLNPLKLTEVPKPRPKRAIDISLSQARIQTAFFASPPRQSLRLEPAVSQWGVGDPPGRITPETPTKSASSPRLMRACKALMESPIRTPESKVPPPTPLSIDELNQFTQALNDDDEVQFDIAYDEENDNSFTHGASQGRDPLLDLFRSSQSQSQTGGYTGSDSPIDCDSSQKGAIAGTDLPSVQRNSPYQAART